jgi:hypothetical protein
MAVAFPIRALTKHARGVLRAPSCNVSPDRIKQTFEAERDFFGHWVTLSPFRGAGAFLGNRLSTGVLRAYMPAAA